MTRRRRTRKSKSVWESFDWSANPLIVREIISIALIVLGVVSLLGLFGLAGKLGILFDGWLMNAFGATRFFTPPILIGLGLLVWLPDRIKIRFSLFLGVATLYVTLPAIFAPNGGWFGNWLWQNVVGVLGTIPSYLFLAGTALVSAALIFDVPLRSIGDVFKLKGTETPNINDNSQGEPRVSVFQTVKSKFGNPHATSVEVTRQKPVITPPGSENWIFPELDLLKLPTSKATSGNISKNVETIAKTLKDFGIDVTMGDVNIGPTVTQYTLKPSEGIKLNQITARANDIALALAAHPIRIEAPIPGKAAVGIEVPNKVPAVVTLREVIETPQFKEIGSNLAIPLGRDAAGAPINVDLKKMPHMLIAGATGSGKSIAINSILMSFLYQNSPGHLRLILVDPKRVEFTAYNNIPHLLAPVIIEPDKTVNTLKWALTEMERRFEMLQGVGSRDIESYNSKNPTAPLPYIVIVIDELADLMAQSAKEVEGAIVRIAQMARAVGMHLIVATQRPSVDVITGLIKANITTRVAFAVASQVDSRTIIDVSGAEKLLGKGDMLFLSSEFSGKPKRIQGCLVTEKEVQVVTNFLKKNAPAQYDDHVINFSPRGSRHGIGLDENADDELYDDAQQVVVQAGKASASLLQRRLRIGYARAARLLDLLEMNGAIGPADGSKPRDVLVGFDDRDFRGPHDNQEFPPHR